MDELYLNKKLIFLFIINVILILSNDMFRLYDGSINISFIFIILFTIEYYKTLNKNRKF